MNNPTAGITAVILASGFSKRMGCNKLLLPVEGKAMIAHVFDAVRQVEFEQTVVVTGFDSIAQLAVGNGFQAVDNDSPEIGQSHSVVLGVQKTSQSAGWMFFNGDMPWLKSDTIGKLLEYADAAHIVVPRYGSRPGQPVYFPAAFKAELLALTGDHGGRTIIRNHPDRVCYVPIDNIRQGGDLATGTISCLHQCGYQVLVLEIAKPTAIRRSVAFSEAMYDGETEVEGIKARKITQFSEAEACWKDGVIPIICDEKAEAVKAVPHFAFVDAAIAKRNLGTTIDMADYVIGLGPGFTAGVDVDVVIETKRGHRLGRIIREGQAIANTGIPGIIGGYGKERVIHSENAGVFQGIAHIGDLVKKGDLIAKVDDAPVYATLDGVLRGILRDGLPVPEHFKIADIDPRLSERENCFTISDKASAIAGGVLRAICIYENELRSGEGRK